MNTQNSNPAGLSDEQFEILAGKNKSFTIFDDQTRPDYTFRPISNRTIRRVCQVLCNCSLSDDEERVYYAKLGEIEPDEIDREKSEVRYNFKDTYKSYATRDAALCYEMFADFPKIYEVTDDEARLTDPDAADVMLRDQVHQAFSVFLSKFGAVQFGPAALLANLRSGPSRTNLGQEILNRTRKQHATNQPRSGGSDD